MDKRAPGLLVSVAAVIPHGWHPIADSCRRIATAAPFTVHAGLGTMTDDRIERSKLVVYVVLGRVKCFLPVCH